MAWEPWKQATLPFRHRDPQQLQLPAVPVEEPNPSPNDKPSKAPPPPPIEI